MTLCVNLSRTTLTTCENRMRNNYAHQAYKICTRSQVKNYKCKIFCLEYSHIKIAAVTWTLSDLTNPCCGISTQ